MIIINSKEKSLTIMYEEVLWIGEYQPENLTNFNIINIDHNRIKIQEKDDEIQDRR